MRKHYIEKLVTMMADTEFDAVLVCPSEELKFFAGFSPMMCERFQGLFIKKDGSLFYVCNLLYGDEIKESFNHEVPVYTWFDGDGMTNVVGKILEEQGLKGATVGVNSSAQAFNVLEISDKCGVNFKNAKPLMEEVRIRKTPEELDNLRKAAAVADAAFEPTIKFIRPGLTEGQIRDFMFEQMASRGGANMWAIVASGPNSGFPHYSGYDRVIQENDLMVLDWGCEINEMQSDISRTVFVGEPTEEQRHIYDLVDRSQLASQEAAVEGAWIPDIDKAARDVLDEDGYAKTLINRVGHGIGYMVHEAPDIKECNPRRLEKGMCFSIEPGIYLANVYGMRIENIVVINEKGETEILNKVTRELTVIK